MTNYRAPGLLCTAVPCAVQEAPPTIPLSLQPYTRGASFLTVHRLTGASPPGQGGSLRAARHLAGVPQL